MLRAADHHVVSRIARVLGEFARRRGLHQLAAHAARETHPFALHVGACGLEQCQRLVIVAEVDADLLQDRIGIVFEQFEAIAPHHFVAGNLPRDVRDEMYGRGRCVPRAWRRVRWGGGPSNRDCWARPWWPSMVVAQTPG